MGCISNLNQSWALKTSYLISKYTKVSKTLQLWNFSFFMFAPKAIFNPKVNVHVEQENSAAATLPIMSQRHTRLSVLTSLLPLNK